MEVEEEQLTFFIRHKLENDKDFVAQVPKSSTIGDLKAVIQDRLGIHVHRQNLEGWKSSPQNEDYTFLEDCSSDEVTILTVSQLPDLEIEACIKFVETTLNIYDLPFRAITLKDVIYENSLILFKEKKIILLYLHIEKSQFSTDFLKNLIHPEVNRLIKNSVTFLGWSIEDSKYHGALKNALIDNRLDALCSLIENKISSVNILLPTSDGLIAFCCIRKAFDLEAFLMYLKGAVNCVRADLEATRSLSNGNSFSTDSEAEACVQFARNTIQIRPETVNFETGTLKDVIKKAFGVPLMNRKILLLYLSNTTDKFSNIFWENMMNQDVIQLIQEGFILYGWDVEDSEYHSALTRALDDNELGNIASLVERKICAAVIIAPIGDSFTTLACMRAPTSSNEFSIYIKNAQEYLKNEIEQEASLQTLEVERSSEDDVDSEKFHTVMASMLGDRDYDSFDFNQADLLEEKIAYALFGPPLKEEGYSKKENKEVKKLYQAIKQSSDEIAELRDQVQIGFIYACAEPLPAEKNARAKKDPNYNPKTDLMPLPIFVIRKCRESEHPCRVFVDHSGRTYQSWDGYIRKNKLHECEMVLPKNGRYTFDEDGKILLERHLSPACGIDTKVIQGFDIASTTTGVVSGGILLVAAIPTVVFPPAALLAAGVAGLGAGLYAVGRSTYSLIDRSIHRQSLSILESEPRGAYLNIVAGALGFVGVGANALVQQLVSRGVNIAEAGIWTVNGIQIANIGASGVSLVNSGYDIVDQYINHDQTPSALTILQLGTSILFFGNAVFSFKNCRSLIDETQQQTLRDFQDSLRSNRHRKTFNKLVKETIRTKDGNQIAGQAEVISTIRKIPNKDEVFAVLTRANKQMNEQNIKFSASDGRITLNGVEVNMSEFAAMSKDNRASFLVKLSQNGDAQTPTQAVETVKKSFVSHGFPQDIDVINLVVKITCVLSGDTKQAIIDIVSKLLMKIAEPLRRKLDELFPNKSKYAGLIDMVTRFISKQTDEFEMQYKKWKQTGDQKYYSKWFDYVNMEEARRWLCFFEKSVAVCLCPTEALFKELLKYFYTWFAEKICEFQQSMEQTAERQAHSADWRANKKDCKICGGYYYTTR
ncbi:unnamed protein product [Acanthoscelides obtectus]|uniref:DUF4781 domain-containing protein n=1 Tax=Acanthoscelides obtectus TaxID=200917 RepID=A0A9P0K5Z7_ACAOB|nr:unnamed protein product [Acanthoscelides obtectus]CAK1648014.1 hypothetical protein AOBTE_LOCUS15501 [Acanthoscelides obtectus]